MGEPNERQDNPSAEQEDTSGKEPETFTREQVEEEKRKAKSDALADIGRIKKSADTAIKAVQAAEERINRMLKEQEEAELETARDEPDKLTVIRERHARREAETKLAQIEQELEEERAKTAEAQEAEAESTKERNAREIASRLGVDAKTLMKFTDGSTEAMEELARVLPGKGETTTLKPDSGKTIGGSGGIPTHPEKYREWIENISQEEYERRLPEINKLKAAGKIK